ncbi:MAG TPA: HEAT repeat domain-containing protein [Thermoanaerobaculia bacterium]|nr:HEAT repeat domain-containing protein [Thermoanaerobaculia bacterium]
MRLNILLLILVLAASAAAAQGPSEPPQIDDARLETASAAGGLSAAVRRAGGDQPVWIGWAVPVVEGQSYACCWTRQWKPDSCQLEGRNQSWGTSSDRGLPKPDPYQSILLRMEAGRVQRVRSFSTNCPLDAGGRRFVWLRDVKPEESVQFLRGLATNDQTRGADLGEEAITAIAFHRNATANEVLADFASPRFNEDLREHSLFWLGQNRGHFGYEVLTRTLRTDPDEDIREKALFGLSESSVPEAGDVLLQAARNHGSPDTRSKALFWLSQMDHPKAPETILEAIGKDADADVREQAVFALSQLPKGKGTPLLIKVGRENRDREIRKQALFWLSQSDDPQAMSFLEKMLE